MTSSGAQVTEVALRGLTFRVRAGGPPDGPPVLLLHGFPQHSGEWRQVRPALHDAGLRTYAPDQRGYSPKARPPAVADYRMAQCVADAVALLDALEIPAAHVIGHDWGAVVAWHLAARHPDRVRTLTAVSVPHPAAFAAVLATDRGQRLRSAYIGLFRRPGTAERVLLAGNAALLRLVFLGVGGDRAAGYVEPMRAPGALTAALNWYRAMSRRDLEGVGPVSVPTTYVWSDRDFSVGGALAHACAEHVTGDYRFVRLRGVSHWIPDQSPARLAEVALERITAA